MRCRPKTEGTMQRLLRLPQVIERTSLSRSTLYELMERGAFPRPVKITGARANAWVQSEVEEYVRARIAQREVLAA
jgi:prophage regulatory protein